MERHTGQGHHGGEITRLRAGDEYEPLDRPLHKSRRGGRALNLPILGSKHRIITEPCRCTGLVHEHTPGVCP